MVFPRKHVILSSESCFNLTYLVNYYIGELKMGKLQEAKEILKVLGMPKKQQGDRTAYVLLSLAGLRENNQWSNASANSLRTVDMMKFMSEHYGKQYAPNSRESVRKGSVQPLCDGAIADQNADDSERATNSGNYSYRLTDEAINVIKTYGTPGWEKQRQSWLENHKTLVEHYKQSKEMSKVPAKVNGLEVKFSPGKHNQLQKEIIEEFLPRFAPGANVLYVGDTAKKDLIKNNEKLLELGIKITDHDKLPDVILYMEEKNWIFFIEAVTSVGPISVKRRDDINAMLENCNCGIVYVTAFLDMGKIFKSFINEIAWETEIWIADNPDHMIHLNGDRFLGPRGA